jgi:ComF family protein
LQGLRSLAPHVAPWREAVQALKYEGLRVLAEPLSAEMARYGERMLPRPQVIVPVPLHTDRQRERGYNQSALLAQGLGWRWGVPVVEEALLRTRSTRAQVGLSGEERRENVRGAFAGPTTALRDQRVLLVDDVCTTGATLEECAHALREAGAATVWALTLTRAR